MMSEDSDYTSDINYPLQHQHNSSAHQFRSEHPYRGQGREDSYDRNNYPINDFYREDSFERNNAYEYGYVDPDRGYDRERDYYVYQDNLYRQGRSDTDSEPMYYNSRPNSRPTSFITDSPVGSRVSSVNVSRQSTQDYSPHGSGATPEYFSPQSTLDYTPTTVEDYETCLYGSDITPENYSPPSPPDHAYTPTADGYYVNPYNNDYPLDNNRIYPDDKQPYGVYRGVPGPGHPPTGEAYNSSQYPTYYNQGDKDVYQYDPDYDKKGYDLDRYDKDKPADYNRKSDYDRKVDREKQPENEMKYDYDRRTDYDRNSDRKSDYSSRKSDYSSRKSDYSSRKSEHDSRKSDYDSRKSDYDSRKSDYDSRKSDYDSRKSDYDRRKGYYDRKSDYGLDKVGYEYGVDYDVTKGSDYDGTRRNSGYETRKSDYDLANTADYDPYQTEYDPPQTDYDPHKVDYDPHKTEYDPHKTEYDPHKEDYDPHKVDYDPHKTDYDPPNVDYDPHKVDYDPHKVEYDPHKTDYDPHKTEYDPHKTEYDPHKTEYDPHKSDYDVKMAAFTSPTGYFNNYGSTEDIMSYEQEKPYSSSYESKMAFSSNRSYEKEPDPYARDEYEEEYEHGGQYPGYDSKLGEPLPHDEYPEEEYERPSEPGAEAMDDGYGAYEQTGELPLQNGRAGDYPPYEGGVNGYAEGHEAELAADSLHPVYGTGMQPPSPVLEEPGSLAEPAVPVTTPPPVVEATPGRIYDSHPGDFILPEHREMLEQAKREQAAEQSAAANNVPPAVSSHNLHLNNNHQQQQPPYQQVPGYGAYIDDGLSRDTPPYPSGTSYHTDSASSYQTAIETREAKDYDHVPPNDGGYIEPRDVDSSTGYLYYL